MPSGSGCRSSWLLCSSSAIGVMTRLKRRMKMIERALGQLLIVVGFALLTGAFSSFSFWLLETFPSLAVPG